MPGKFMSMVLLSEIDMREKMIAILEQPIVDDAIMDDLMSVMFYGEYSIDLSPQSMEYDCSFTNHQIEDWCYNGVTPPVEYRDEIQKWCISALSTDIYDRREELAD